jgi:hypothetical protein
MGGTRTVARQAPAIIIALVALMVSLGGGAWATTRSPSHAKPGIVPAAITWSSLTLVNGWTSENTTYGTGDPRVSIQNGVVYLSGSLAQSTPGDATFATLPSAYRPAHNMYITVYTNSSTTGTLFIAHSGVMEAYSSTSCGSGDTAQCFTSLATVSFPINS